MAGKPFPKVLVIGVDPDTLNPADWGVTAEENAAVKRLIADGEAALRTAGYAVEVALIAIDPPLEETLMPKLEAEQWDCVVVGGASASRLNSWSYSSGS